MLPYLRSMEASFFNINLPESWQSLTDDQLHYAYTQLQSSNSITEVMAHCLLHWGKLTVLCHYPNHRFLIQRKRTKEQVILTTAQLQSATSALKFLDSFSTIPVRISHIGHHQAIAADFEQVQFDTYLYADNLYQGYLQTQSNDLLMQMAQVLYGAEDSKEETPVSSNKVNADEAELIGIFYWFTSLKIYFSRMFPNFLKPFNSPSSNLLAQQDTFTQLRNAMNAQIRALTGGDITKEDQILQKDTWRALTELDAKAKDAEELRKQYK
ncbi:hypothetical protein SAMN04487899_1188 [Segatella bryantii]|nr:hypothetical protein SAMN04487899_1188 [Segatella bryantii]